MRKGFVHLNLVLHSTFNFHFVSLAALSPPSPN